MSDDSVNAATFAAQLAHFEATLNGVVTRLDSQDRKLDKQAETLRNVGKPNWGLVVAIGGVMATLIAVAVAVMTTIGTMALSPVSAWQEEHAHHHEEDYDTFLSWIRRVEGEGEHHRSDGHPEKVLEQITNLKERFDDHVTRYRSREAQLIDLLIRMGAAEVKLGEGRRHTAGDDEQRMTLHEQAYHKQKMMQ